jgi:hypothetical protein
MSFLVNNNEVFYLFFIENISQVKNLKLAIFEIKNNETFKL